MMSNAMRPWRTLKLGMEGPDVEALQRGLWRALGAPSTNARNGVYGEETANDVLRYRRLKKMYPEVGGDEVGALLYAQLQMDDAFDARAYVLASNQPAGVKVEPIVPRLPLRVGMSGSDVGAAQRAMWRALDGDSTNARNGVYGDQTVRDVRRFRDRFDVFPDDPATSIGDLLWAVLTRWMDGVAIAMAVDAPKPPAPEPAENWEKVASEAWGAYERRFQFRYVQARPIEGIHDIPLIRTDCSGFYTGCCQSAQVPNPNRSDGIYDGYGYTGSLWENGRWATSPRAGDAAMYGDPYGSTGHVAVYMGDGTVVSFGHDPMEHYPVRYREDFRGIRTFH